MLSYRTAKGNAVTVEVQRILRVVPLDEVRASTHYDDMADLAVIFHHLIVEVPGEPGQVIWRWKANNLIRWLHDYAPIYMPSAAESIADGDMVYGRGCTDGRASINLNGLSADLLHGEFAMQEYMKYHMQIGYSLCGFSEIFGQRSAEESGLPDAKQSVGDDRETIIEYMLRVHAGKVLSL